MAKQFSVEMAVCGEYLRLLEESRKALEMWNTLRVEVSQARLASKEDGDELLRLQAKYARAYTALSNHAHNCSRCQLVSGIAGPN
jgi:phage baseplate assembly protein W